MKATLGGKPVPIANYTLGVFQYQAALPELRRIIGYINWNTVKTPKVASKSLSQQCNHSAFKGPVKF